MITAGQSIVAQQSIVAGQSIATGQSIAPQPSPGGDTFRILTEGGDSITTESGDHLVYA